MNYDRTWSWMRTVGIKLVLGTCLIGMSGFIVSCSGGADAAISTSDDPVQDLKNRVQAFWDTRLEMHHLYEDEGAYNAILARQFDFWDPEFKKQMRLTAYQASKGSAIYEKFQLVDVTVDGDVGVAHIIYDWRIKTPPAGLTSESTLTTSEITDAEWMRVDGVWYKKFDMKKAMGGGAPGRRPTPPVPDLIKKPLIGGSQNKK